ncbi:MAG: hypothetical protein GQ582_02240 [Methyloprofundus sp.]|nr:hypothetical protein [Methyloprofundus sp.]
MQDQLSELLFYVKGTLKYKWLILATTWLIACASWIFVTSLPDEFQSKAIVNVDSTTMLRPLLRGLAIQSNTRGLVHVMRQLMFTRPKLERVAELADLGINEKTEVQKVALIEELKQGIKINGGKNDLFQISYDGDNSQVAQNIVHAVLTVFSEQTQQRGAADTGSAQQFISEQIREYETRLKNAEKARENFKRINSGLLPSQGKGQIELLSAIKQELQRGEMALSEVSSKETVLNKQIEEALTDEVGWAVDGMAESTEEPDPEDVQIAALKQMKTQLLVQYTENHPDVKGIEVTIGTLQKSKAERLASLPGTDNELNTAAMSSPYTQALKASLNQIETDKASIVSRVEVLTQRLVDIEEGLNSRLRIETEMQNLDRDYSVIQSNYMNLVKSRETASLTQKADQSQGVLKFKIVEAPTAPIEPTGPMRRVFNTVGLIMGAMIGFVLAFLIYFIKPTFMTVRQLRAVTNIPVLGSIGSQVYEGGIYKLDKKNKRFFYFFSILLLLIYCLMMSNIFASDEVRAQLMKIISLVR